MEHIFSTPSTSTLMSEILLRQQQQQSELFQHWQKLEDTATQSSWERDTLLTQVYSNKCSDEQQQRQFLATQLLYAQFLQQPQSERVTDIAGLSNKASATETTTNNRSSSTLAQDNNNNNRASSKRCKQETDSNSPKGNLIREQKNALCGIKKGLEKLMRLCNKFQQNLRSPLLNDGELHQKETEKQELQDMALELTVQRELDNNRRKIESMLLQIRRLHHQWSSAELYYQRSLQRLGLSSSEALGTSLPTHDVMALAAIALSAECELQTKSEMQSAEDTSTMDSPHRTLQDIENIMLQKVVQERLQNASSSNSSNESEGELEEAAEDSSPCLWHPRNFRPKASKQLFDGAGTAAEIILEYASQSQLTTSLVNPIVTADNLHEPASYLTDFHFPPTPATPPNSSNSSCSTGTISGTPCKHQHRRKSHYARKIEALSTTPVNYQSELSGNGIKVSIASLPIECPTAAPSPCSISLVGSSSAVAAVAAFKERALTDMFKAQFSTMTVTGGNFNESVSGSDIKSVNTIGTGSGSTALNENDDGLVLSDAPYDLSIGNRLKQM